MLPGCAVRPRSPHAELILHRQVFDLTQDGAAYNASTGVGAVGVEFAGSAVSSPSSYGSKLNETVYKRVAEALTSSNPHLQYAEGQLRGYYELTLTPTLLTADYYGFPDQGTRNSQVVKMATFNVIAGEVRPFRLAAWHPPHAHAESLAPAAQQRSDAPVWLSRERGRLSPKDNAMCDMGVDLPNSSVRSVPEGLTISLCVLGSQR